MRFSAVFAVTYLNWNFEYNITSKTVTIRMKTIANAIYASQLSLVTYTINQKVAETLI